MNVVRPEDAAVSHVTDLPVPVNADSVSANSRTFSGKSRTVRSRRFSSLLLIICVDFVVDVWAGVNSRIVLTHHYPFQIDTMRIVNGYGRNVRQQPWHLR